MNAVLTNPRGAAAFEDSAARQPLVSASTAVSPRKPVRSEEEPTVTAAGLYCSGEIRILVLDDDEQISRMIQEALQAKGFHVDAVSDTRLIGHQLQQQP